MEEPKSIIQYRNIANCCRTCLEDLLNKEIFDLFSDISDSVNVAEMLKTCFSIKISPHDKLPKKLCETCYNSLVGFHAFKIQAQNIDQKLNEHFCMNVVYNENNNKIIDETVLDAKCKDFMNEIDDYDDVAHGNTENTDIFCVPYPSTVDNVLDYDNHCESNNSVPLETSIPKSKKIGKHKHVQEAETKVLVNKSQSIEKERHESFECDICSAKFKTKNSLSGHKRKHAAKGRVLSCVSCGKIFKKISHLKRHELTHDTKKPYKCMLCKKSYKRMVLLEEHLNRHKDGSARRCPFCPKSFWHMATLAEHVKRHTNSMQHLCSVCGKKFSSTGNLKQHQLRHAGEKSYACEMCPKKFVSKGELKTHIITHTGERLFSCEKCPAKFTRRSTLLKHNFRHLGIKPYNCDTCPMKFITKSHLIRHCRVHTGERPYRCEICDRTFTQSNDLEKHKRAHFGNEIYECPVCSQRFRLKMELTQHESEHFISSKLEQMRVNTENVITTPLGPGNIENVTETNSGIMIEH
ncbi:hypothetical protein K1T71_008408 [Dendrolimus kikuchii]|uniref:Uncharacterized protein n=1 Tax=Dendrolimus kikuchii TaxID=765133 RepID=A0ACC1CWY2_9NEOP|nr:hypothetical protein K1T71_008408 [Dendrolimus kikuchii]